VRHAQRWVKIKNSQSFACSDLIGAHGAPYEIRTLRLLVILDRLLSILRTLTELMRQTVGQYADFCINRV
jgi:hypothetical protein